MFTTSPPQSSRMPICFTDASKIPPEYLAYFSSCCRHLDPNLPNVSNLAYNNNPAMQILDTCRVYKLLKSSALNNEILGLIWASVNQTIPGQLTRPEFFGALALVALAQVWLHSQFFNR